MCVCAANSMIVPDVKDTAINKELSLGNPGEDSRGESRENMWTSFDTVPSTCKAKQRTKQLPPKKPNQNPDTAGYR